MDNYQASTPQAGAPFGSKAKRSLALEAEQQKAAPRREAQGLPLRGSPYLSDLERCLDTSPARGVCISVTLRKSPACRCAGRLRGYELTLPRPCQGRPPAALSGRSSQVFGRVLGAVKLELLGLSLPPWTDPLVGGFYSARPKASSSPNACREAVGGSLELYSATIAAQNLASRSRVPPAKQRFPETSAGRCVNTARPFEPSPVIPQLAGVCRFWWPVIPAL